MGNRTVITGLSRTPMGNARSCLRFQHLTWVPLRLQLLSRSGLSVNDDRVWVVLPAGLGQAPARPQ